MKTIRVPANGLNFEVLESAEPTTGDRVAICLHGFPEHAFSWRFQAPFLASHGYRVWAPNLRGYGASDCPQRVEDYRAETLIEDVAALIRAAGGRETLLIGHDWGGVLAWGVAMRYPQLVTRLAILNGPHPAIMLRELRRPRQMMRSWYMLAFRIPVLPELLIRAGNYRLLTEMMRRTAADAATFPDHVLAVYRRNAARPGGLTAMLNWYRALGSAVPRKFPRIAAKTLILWGERDPFLGPGL
ncbi:MAG: alpha/beta hydrolase, partial [Acidobacteriota bacterium]|nr:alpha/beta hydrolase [Acidobacteriota bacterium]